MDNLYSSSSELSLIKRKTLILVVLKSWRGILPPASMTSVIWESLLSGKLKCWPIVKGRLVTELEMEKKEHINTTNKRERTNTALGLERH